MVYQLATRLDRSRFEARVVALRGGEVGDWLVRAGVDVRVLGMRGKRDAHRLAGLPRLLRERPIDILHTHLFHADFAARLTLPLLDVPHLVHTVHVAERRWRPWQFAFARLTDPLCDRVVCVSRGVRNHHAALAHLPPHRYVVIPNGIDTAAFAPDPAARVSLRGQWGVGEGETVVAFVGRLDPQKGVDVLLRAFDEVARRRADVRFVLAGEGPLRGLVEQALQRDPLRGRARYLGFVRDVPALLAGADVLAAPSRWEGLPLATVEAMAAGVAVVATRGTGHEEAVADGRTGVLVPIGDPGELANALDGLAADGERRKAMGLAGRVRARECFDIAENVRRHERLYEAVAGGESRVADGGLRIAARRRP